MRDITLRQIEVIRAVMLRGTIIGAAEYLGVSAPGISRLLKHTEETLNLRLFERRGGLFVPSVEAQAVFDQIRTVYRGVENLQLALDSLKKGQNVQLAFASAPSVAQFIAARAIRNIRAQFPDLYIDLNILKIEETVDYLLLERGEFVIMSSAVDNPGIDSELIAETSLVCVLPEGHRLAGGAAGGHRSRGSLWRAADAALCRERAGGDPQHARAVRADRGQPRAARAGGGADRPLLGGRGLYARNRAPPAERAKLHPQLCGDKTGPGAVQLCRIRHCAVQKGVDACRNRAFNPLTCKDFPAWLRNFPTHE